MADTEERQEALEKGTDWFRLALILGVTAFFAYRVGLSVLLIVVALVFMIFMHELGHYLTARAAGMKVTEFFIGFGPRIWSFKRGETEYGIKPIPAGAYVKIIGMSNLEEVDPADEARTYRQKSYPRRLSVAVAGSAMHFLMALVLVFLALSAIGRPSDEGGRAIAEVEPETAAVEAGLEPGDQILAIDGRDFSDDYFAMREYIQEHPGDDVELSVRRDDEVRTLTATLGSRDVDGEAIGLLGIVPETKLEREGIVSGAVESVQLTGEMMWQTVKGIASVLSPSGLSGYVDTLTSVGEPEDPEATGIQPEDGNRFISPVGVVRIADQTWQAGAGQFVMFLFMINVFIGMFNLLPLLPFDGGHVAIATYERIREIGRGGRRYFADVSKLMPLTYGVVLLLAFIFLSSLFLDIADPLQLQ